MRLYIAGPARGQRRMGFPAFMEAENRLRLAGYEVHNPAADAILHYGANPDKGTLRSPEQVWPRIQKNLRSCQGIAFLPGWQQSVGARMEFWFAVRNRIDTLGLETWIRIAKRDRGLVALSRKREEGKRQRNGKALSRVRQWGDMACWPD